MFEDEDWNINEDDLKEFNNDDDVCNDNNDKTENVLSLKNAETKEKTVILLNASALKCNNSDTLQNNVILQSITPISQKDIVLNVFKRSSDSQEVLKNYQQNSLIFENEEPIKCTSHEANERSKNVILNVFKENIGKPKPVVKSVLKVYDHENKCKRKKNVAFLDSPSESNVTKKVCIEKANITQEAKNYDVDIDLENQSSPFDTSVSSIGDIDNCKKQMLINLSKSSVHKVSKVPRLKQAVIRKFPGPAGILPDDVNENDITDLDSLDENKNNKSNQYADICSQNTKNLFTTGAWQLMMDDLPADFELYDIATIKENAVQYSKTYRKVPYLAGIVQYIDYKPNDPHIILKDLSGRVDARIHHSICKLYPNALGTSIVILAKDVGLIVTSKKFVCIIISLNNLVSIYSDDARLVETSHLKTLFKNEETANLNLHKSHINVLNEIEFHDNNETCKTNSHEINNSHQEQAESILKNACNIEKVKDVNRKDISELKIIDKDMDVHEFEFDEDDSWLGVNITESNSFKPHQFPSSTPLDTHNKNSNDVYFQVKTFKNASSSELQNTSELGKIVSSSKQPCSMYDKKSTISDKLLQFRNVSDTTSQQTISKQLGFMQNISRSVSKPFEQKGNDTDDEMLSQLDVDAIAANYRTQNC